MSNCLETPLVIIQGYVRQGIGNDSNFYYKYATIHLNLIVYIFTYLYIWVFPNIGVPQHGWFIREIPLLELMIWGSGSLIFGSTFFKTDSPPQR